MASAEFLEQALFKDVDENAVNAIVGSLENQLVTSASSGLPQSGSVNNISSQCISSTSSANSSGISKYNANTSGSINFIQTGSNNVQSIATNSFVPQSVTNSSNEPIKVYSQSHNFSNSMNSVNFPIHSLANGVIGLSSQPNQIIHTVPTSAIQSGNKISMQPPLVIKQGTSTGQVGIQPGMVTVPMTVNSSMPTSIPNVMTLNKPGQNVVVTTQNIGSAQPTIIPNVQILNMRPGTPAVAAQKSVATVSPRVVIGAPQVVGARAAAPGITLQTLQSLQPGQQGHLLLKTENGQYQLLRVGPAPPANSLAAPQAQTIRLSTVPAHPGVATVSTSVAMPGQMANQMPGAPVATPVPASGAPIVAPAPASGPPTVTTQKPSDNTKEKCRNFLANLLDLSSKEPEVVERNVRSLIQELIDGHVEPGEFCDRLERLLNASPQPCLIGFLEKSLPLLRQSLVTKELIIEGINPPLPHVAFSNIPAPTQPTIVTSNVPLLSEDELSSPTFTPLLPPVMAVSLSDSLMPSPKPINVLPMQAIPLQLFEDELSSPTFTPLLPQVVAVSLCDSLVPSPKPINVLPMQAMPLQQLEDELSSPTYTPLLPPVMAVSLCDSLVPSPKPINVLPVQAIPVQQKPGQKGNIAVLQNIPVQTKINVSKVSAGKAMASMGNKGGFSKPGLPPSAALSTVLTPSKSLLKEKEKKVMQYSSQTFDDKMAGDDDINDVAAMGGVNLAEETQRILGSTEMIGTQIRSCKDEYLIPMSMMQSRIKAMSAKHGLDEPSIEVAGLISHAVHERLKSMVEKLAIIAQHRIDLIIKTDSRYEMTQDVKGQLKFLEELDRVDKKRREDSERELLLRAAKSRSKNEDPEQAKLKAKAKEMQRAELEELRQREANLTALQAIGPRKKARLDGPGAAGDVVTQGPQTNSAFTGRSQLALRTRLKRINHRDMVFLLEQEKDTAHSSMLFRGYLK